MYFYKMLYIYIYLFTDGYVDPPMTLASKGCRASLLQGNPLLDFTLE